MIEYGVGVAAGVTQAQVHAGLLLVKIHASRQITPMGVIVVFHGKAATGIQCRFIPLVAQFEIALIADFRRGGRNGMHQLGILDVGIG